MRETRATYKDKALDSMPLIHGAALLTLLVVPGFTLGIKGTPVITSASLAKLDKPGLWLSAVRWIQPETGRGEVLTFRVYCPTRMMRDVTNGRWGDAANVTAMAGQGYATGVVETAYQQACK